MSINVEGYRYQNPIPAASRVKNVVATGAIEGQDPIMRAVPDDPFEQARLTFVNLKRILEAAGGHVEDIVRIVAFIRNDSVFEALDREWSQMFPDAEKTPARHTMIHQSPGNILLQVRALAILQ